MGLHRRPLLPARAIHATSSADALMQHGARPSTRQPHSNGLQCMFVSNSDRYTGACFRHSPFSNPVQRTGVSPLTTKMQPGRRRPCKKNLSAAGRKSAVLRGRFVSRGSINSRHTLELKPRCIFCCSSCSSHHLCCRHPFAWSEIATARIGQLTINPTDKPVQKNKTRQEPRKIRAAGYTLRRELASTFINIFRLEAGTLPPAAKTIS